MDTPPPNTAATIPLIDLERSYSPKLEERTAVAREIARACREVGFFYVKNHRVPLELCARQLQLAREFFALPLAQKLACDINSSTCRRGYEAMRSQTLDDAAPPDLKEGFMIGNEHGPEHPYVKQGIPLCGPNQWPAAPGWFREQYEAYIAHMLTLGKHLVRCLALSLELEEDYFDGGFEDPFFAARLLHYPPHPEGADDQYGAGAHCDWGTMAMLLQDDCGGLEVQTPSGAWVAAPPIEGTLVINLGEMSRVLTNNHYKSALHRVINKSGRDRYSVPTFIDPDFFYKMKAVPTCLPADGSGSFEITIGEHIHNMMQKTYGAG